MDAFNLILKESIAIIKSFMVKQNFCLIGSNESPNAKDDSLPAVLLIPGYMCRKGCFIEFYTKLVSCGFRVFMHEPSLLTSSIKKHSRQLRKYILKIKKEYDLKSLFVIGYSMGGLIARDTFADGWDGEFSFITHLYTVATPNNGTIMSNFGIGTCTNEMKPGSSFIRELNTRDIHCRAKITCYSAELDGIILTDKNVNLDGCRTFKVSNVGHMSIIDDPSFHDHLIEDIRQFININQ